MIIIILKNQLQLEVTILNTSNVPTVKWYQAFLLNIRNS